jgi:pilus assembly protein Flp/PilA
MRSIFAFLHDTKGATAIEYAMIAAGVAGAIITTVSLAGTGLQNKYTLVLNKFTGAE